MKDFAGKKVRVDLIDVDEAESPAFSPDGRQVVYAGKVFDEARSLLRSAIGIPQLPPNQILIGLAMFLSLFVMAPVWTRMNTEKHGQLVEFRVHPRNPCPKKSCGSCNCFRAILYHQAWRWAIGNQPICMT